MHISPSGRKTHSTASALEQLESRITPSSLGLIPADSAFHDLSVITVADITHAGAHNQATGLHDDLITYTITCTNSPEGPELSDATGVSLAVTFDSHQTFKPAENPGWTLSAPGHLTKNVGTGTLPGGAHSTDTLKLHVESVVGNGFSGSNIGSSITVNVSETTTNNYDFYTSNNASHTTVSLIPSQATHDLVVTTSNVITHGSAHPTAANHNDLITYTISYANNAVDGNINASGVVLSVTLDSHQTFDQIDNPGWAQSGLTLTKTVGGLASGASGTATLKLRVESHVSSGTSTSSITTTLSESTSGLDSNTSNNASTSTVTLVPGDYTGIYATAPGVAIGGKYAPPVIRVFDAVTHTESFHFRAYAFRDSIRVAIADMNHDGYDDIITTTQHGNGHLRVFNGLTGHQFTTGQFANEIAITNGTTEHGGAFVAAGDVTGDGINDIVVGSALGGGKIKVYDGAASTPTVLAESFPFGKTFRGGVRVAVGDVSHDARQTGLLQADSLYSAKEIIAGQGNYGGMVQVYQVSQVSQISQISKVPQFSQGSTVSNSTLTKIAEFSVGAKGYKGGVSVAAGDVNQDGYSDLVVGRNSGKPSMIQIFDGRSITDASTHTLDGVTTLGTVTQLGASIMPFSADKNGYGVRVATVVSNGHVEILASVGVKNNSKLAMYSVSVGGTPTYTPITLATGFDQAYPDYANVALWVAGCQGSNY